MAEQMYEAGAANASAKGRNLHAGWFEHWAPEITDSRLRQALFENHRLHDRMVVEIAGASAVGIMAGPQLPQAMAVQQFTKEEFQHIGLCWFAPRLFLCLFDPVTRQVFGDLAPKYANDIKTMRDHARLELLPPLPEIDGLVKEGQKCYLAWLDGSETDGWSMARFGFDPGLIAQNDRAVIRRDFFALYLTQFKDSGLSK